VLQFLIGNYSLYVATIGFLALGIEAVLPIPQFISHYRRKSVTGFRMSVITAWLIGDIFKVSYFIFGQANVQWQFKACALIQFSFDIGIGVQFLMYRDNNTGWNANGNALQQIEEELEEGIIKP
jgi:solute carrier family 66, member 2